MPIRDLQEFISELDQAGELARIQTEVDPDLEISEIYFRHARSPGGGKALLFENVKGSNMPVLINALGSFERVRIAFGGKTPDEKAAEMAGLLRLLEMKAPSGPGEIVNVGRELVRALRFPPRKKRFGRARCQEVVWTGENVRLDKIPVLRSWPGDPAPFITFGMTVTRSLTGAKNLGLYRMQVLDHRTTAMHWQIHKDGSHFWGDYRRAGRRMPVSVVIGADPTVMYSSLAPMPPGINEFLLAGFLRGRGVPMTRCITNDLEVPADAEIVLEGFVDPEDLVDEGPFGDHTGYYTPVEKFPRFHITAITMRKNPVYSATVVGRSPQEDCYLAHATERLFLPLLRMVAPEVVDQMLPWDGCFHNGAVMSVHKHFPFQARRLMSHLWGFSQMSFCKSFVMVDGNVPLREGPELLDHILNRVRIPEDILVGEGILDQLDHSGLHPLYGGKIGIDATSPIPGEDVRLEAAKKKIPPLRPSSAAAALKKKRIRIRAWAGAGEGTLHPVLIAAVEKKKGQGGFAAKAASARMDGTGIVILLDSDADVNDASYVLWKLYGAVDPLRDIRFSGKDRRIVIFDATSKNRADGYDRDWPEENRMSEEVIRIVDRKWKEMFGEEAFAVKRP